MTEAERTPAPEFPQAPLDAIATPFQRFIHTEAAGGAVLLVVAVIAMALANSPLGSAFESLWTTSVGLRIGGLVWDYPLRHWINDGLMTLFFFVVGLEIKRELVFGELSAPGAAALPLAAALGGMLVPAGIYLALASGPGASAGWGAVMATDIAFVVGCLALLGRRVPKSLRVFVLALAIIDDIGAMLVIALGYSHGFHPLPFAGALAGLGIVVLMQRLGVRQVAAYWAVGLLVWAAMHESGVHPTIAGVALGLLTPVRPWVEPSRLEWFLEWGRRAAPAEVGDGGEHAGHGARRRLERAARESISPEQRLGETLHPWSAFLVLPLFAFANAGVTVSDFGAAGTIILATVAGLAIGKPLGIFAFARLAVMLRLARKPGDLGWTMLLAAGSLCGIGFTMALFIAGLAFEAEALHAAKLGVLVASLLSGALGMAALWAASRGRGGRLRTGTPS
jgi:NhaA family Na+:H+ antiporter